MNVFYVFTSCKPANNSKNTLLSSIQPAIIQDVSHDIPLFVNIWKKHPTDGDRDMIFKIVNETSDSVYIDASSPYYDHYISEKRFMLPIQVYDDEIYCGYLNLQFDVVNNTDVILDIEELNINVTSSQPDSLPFLDMYTALVYSNAIVFRNQSWFNWRGFHFRYSFIKRGEKFNGKYQYNRHINYFDYDTIINLLPELIENGYNFKRVCESLFIDFSEKDYDCICRRDYDYKRLDKLIEEGKEAYEPCEPSCYETICIGSSDTSIIDSINTLFYPFEVEIEVDTLTFETEEVEQEEDNWGAYRYYYTGYANLIGEIEFDKSKYKVLFYANVILGVDCGFGAGSYDNDKFDVVLRNNDTNYMLRFPYTTVIYPGGSEMVSLTIKAPQSSNHIFNASLKNGNGLTIKSKDINVHYMLPRCYIINN